MKFGYHARMVCAMIGAVAVLLSCPVVSFAAKDSTAVPIVSLDECNDAASENVVSLIDQIGPVNRSRRAAIVAALDAYNALSDEQKAGVTNYQVLVEAQQKLGIQDAISVVNMTCDAVENNRSFAPKNYGKNFKKLTCSVYPVLYSIGDHGKLQFRIVFSYIGKTPMDLDEIVIRAGEHKFTYDCDYSNSDGGYDSGAKRWCGLAIYDIDDARINELREMLAEPTVTIRFDSSDSNRYDYTLTPTDRQGITDIIRLYDAMNAAAPAVRMDAMYRYQ